MNNIDVQPVEEDNAIPVPPFHFSCRMVRLILLGFLLVIVPSSALAVNKFAETMDILGRKAYKAKNYDLAEILWKRAAEEGMRNGFEYAPCALEELADFYVERRDYSQAEKWYNDTLKVYKKEWGIIPASLIPIYVKFANLYLLTNRPDDAKKMLVNAFSCFPQVQAKRGGKIVAYSDMYISLADKFVELAQYMLAHQQAIQAESCLNSALSIIVSIKDGAVQQVCKAEYLDLLGRTYLQEKKYSLALEPLKRAIAIERKNFSDDEWEVSEYLNDYHEALVKTNHMTEANQIGKSLYKAWPKKSFVDSQEWGALIRKASLKVPKWDGGIDEKESAFQALGLSMAFCENDVRFSESNARLALLQDKYGDYKEVIPLIDKAVASREQALGKDNPFLMKALLSWAAVLVDSHRDYEPAFILNEKIISLAESTVASDNGSALKGAEAVANYCKNMLASHAFDRDKLFTLYERSYNVLVRAKSANNEAAINCLCDLIYFEKESVFYPYKEAKHVSELFEQLLATKQRVYGATNREVKETAQDYADFLQKINNADQAIHVQKIYGLNRTQL
jgi:tetratricopeptide (TPR) repeat protein